jgi:alpha-tubulin suppressor-like RCC1 family protein
VTVGKSSACALLRSGGVKCWGEHLAGDPGPRSAAQRSAQALRPVAVPGIADVVSIAAGSYHACAVRRSGALSCWGRNDWGNLGDGTHENRAAPIEVPGIGDVAWVALGGQHTCVRLRGGSILCWGLNETSQLGDGTSRSRAQPGSVAGLP